MWNSECPGAVLSSPCHQLKSIENGLKSVANKLNPIEINRNPFKINWQSWSNILFRPNPSKATSLKSNLHMFGGWGPTLIKIQHYTQTFHTETFTQRKPWRITHRHFYTQKVLHFIALLQTNATSFPKHLWGLERSSARAFLEPPSLENVILGREWPWAANIQALGVTGSNQPISMSTKNNGKTGSQSVKEAWRYAVRTAAPTGAAAPIRARQSWEPER